MRSRAPVGNSIAQNQNRSNTQTQTVTQMQQTPVTTRQTGVIQNEAVCTVDKHTVDTIDRIAKRTGFSVERVCCGKTKIATGDTTVF